MQTVRIYRLKNLDWRTRARLQAAQQEDARVWNYCLERHHSARLSRTRWPDREDLQHETSGGQYALHSQSIQMVCQQFLGNVATIKQLRQRNPRHRYPYHRKQYRTVQWPAQAVSHQGRRLLLPMGRGRKSFSFHLPDLPEQIGAVSVVWRGGYELHLVVPAPAAEGGLDAEQAVQASVDLGEIHQAAVTTSTGKGLIVTGRGMRSLKRQHNKVLGRLSRLRARCQRGSKRWRRLQYTRARERGKTERRVRDLRHKGTRQVVDFCRAEGVQSLYVGDPLEKEANRTQLDLSALWLCGPPRHRGEHEHASPGLWFADQLSGFAHVSTARPVAGQAAG